MASLNSHAFLYYQSWQKRKPSLWLSLAWRLPSTGWVKRSVSLLCWEFTICIAYLKINQPNAFFIFYPFFYRQGGLPFLDKMCVSYKLVQSVLGVILSESRMVRHGDFMGHERCMIMILRVEKGLSWQSGSWIVWSRSQTMCGLLQSGSKNHDNWCWPFHCPLSILSGLLGGWYSFCDLSCWF